MRRHYIACIVNWFFIAVRLSYLYSNYSGFRNSPEYLLPVHEALLRKIEPTGGCLQYRTAISRIYQGVIYPKIFISMLPYYYRNTLFSLWIGGMFFCSIFGAAQLFTDDAPELRGIDIKEHLGAIIPLDLSFTNDLGKQVFLRDAFEKGKPVLLVLGYYECPMLCTLVLNGVAKSVKHLAWTPGIEYNIVTISIDPNEDWTLANAKKKVYLKAIEKDNVSEGWQFWTGEEKAIKTLANALGFHYFYDPKQDEYAHPGVIFILTDDGKISRYLYGIEYPKSDVKISLLEAANGKIGTILNRLILFCYHYDPVGKKYVLWAANLMRIGGIVTVILCGTGLGFLWLKEKNKTL